MPAALSTADFFQKSLATDSKASLNLQIQAVRSLGHRAKQFQQIDPLLDALPVALTHAEPSVRFAAVQAVHEAAQTALVPELLEQLQRESDTTVFYAGWQALRKCPLSISRSTGRFDVTIPR